MEQCSHQLPPIKGVIHTAMVLRDVVFEKMTYEDWTVPLPSKLQGSWNLHTYFGHERPLDFMIFCSSLSGICGNTSQAQYAAGNSYQDALKVWGKVLGIGEPAFHTLMKSLINRQLRRRGSREDEASVQVCLGLGTADIGVNHRLASPAYFTDPRFGPLAVTSLTSTTGGVSGEGFTASLASRISEADPTSVSIIITDALVKKNPPDILRIPASEVNPSRSMYRYGVDSLVALEVGNWITREMEANISLFEILATVPMENFAAQIALKSPLVVRLAPP